MILSDLIGIVADDLTGANDTALQFQKRGANTQILLDYNSIPEDIYNADVFAVSTESRNIPPEDAIERVEHVVKEIASRLCLVHFYKKIDSTVRGNIAVETLKMLTLLNMDAAVVIPAFPSEGRITVGGYQLLRGIPIGRTEHAKDPHSPIVESHVPSLLKNQLEEKGDIVSHIELKTIMNGAGPILMKINELIKSGKKLIVADAASIVDIEQIILAINKCEYNILPTGTAATAKVLANIWLPETYNESLSPQISKRPKLIISGSATEINTNQIDKFKNSDEFDNIFEIPLTERMVIEGVKNEIVNLVTSNLNTNNIVLVHSSRLVDNFDGFSDDSLNAELTKAKFASKITDYLADLTKKVLSKQQVMLVTLGGETSYKCCKAIGTNELTLLDEVSTAIAICKDKNDQLIITKSGNLGNSNTLIDIMKYINCHEQLQ